MNVTVYLENENNESLDSNNNYENYYDSNSYIKALEDSYYQTKDVIYESMNNGFSSLLKGDNNTFNAFNSFTNKPSKNEEKHSYCTCEASLLTENFENLNINDLVKLSFNKDVSIIIFKFDSNTSEEDFDMEFKLWLTSHNNIQSSKTNDDWKMANEPKRDLRIKFINNINTESYALLHNCKIIDNIDNIGYAILIERISFINDIN